MCRLKDRGEVVATWRQSPKSPVPGHPLNLIFLIISQCALFAGAQGYRAGVMPAEAGVCSSPPGSCESKSRE